MADNVCRCCGSNNVFDSNSGVLAAFFAKRVWGLELPTIGEYVDFRFRVRNSIKRRLFASVYHAIKKIPMIERFVDRRFLPRVKIRVCDNCGFVGPQRVFSYEELSGLYSDYRSVQYNLDRCSVEPTYSALMDVVGKCDAELSARLSNVDEVLKGQNIEAIETVMDWGGGDGRFVPGVLSDKIVYILDVSNEKPVNENFIRVDALDPQLKFDYVQVCHVLEHVSEPLAFVRNVLGCLKKGGLIYIEVPQDRSDVDIERFKKHPNQMIHTIHEHLNIFSENALRELGAAAGLKEVLVQGKVLDMGWGESPIVSGLFVWEN